MCASFLTISERFGRQSCSRLPRLREQRERNRERRSAETPDARRNPRPASIARARSNRRRKNWPGSAKTLACSLRRLPTLRSGLIVETELSFSDNHSQGYRARLHARLHEVVQSALPTCNLPDNRTIDNFAGQQPAMRRSYRIAVSQEAPIKIPLSSIGLHQPCARPKKNSALEHLDTIVWVYWKLESKFRFTALAFPFVTQPDMGDA